MQLAVSVGSRPWRLWETSLPVVRSFIYVVPLRVEVSLYTVKVLASDRRLLGVLHVCSRLLLGALSGGVHLRFASGVSCIASGAGRR